MTLQVLSKRKHGEPETKAVKVKIRSGKSKLIALRPKPKFASKLSDAKKALVKETISEHGVKKTALRRLRLIRK